MKALALITYTDCENKWRSLQAVGHEVDVLQYDDRPHGRHEELVDAAKALKPDFIVFIGAIEQYHGRPVPQPHIFRKLRAVAPLIHECNDAADPPWWPMLELYNREDCFTVQVAIDGSHACPIANFPNGLILLTPIDHRPFQPKPWDGRSIKMSMVGGLGHSSRAVICQDLINRGWLSFHAGPVGRTYAEMAHIMCDSQVTFNYGFTGSTTAFHVKGRVVEAGFAGCCLIEHESTPTYKWFIPGIEYLQYHNADDVEAWLAPEYAERRRDVAVRFHERVVREHHPKVFWDTVLAKAGVTNVSAGA